MSNTGSFPVVNVLCDRRMFILAANNQKTFVFVVQISDFIVTLCRTNKDWTRVFKITRYRLNDTPDTQGTFRVFCIFLVD